jgi:O-antigen/teichoic acid export membrane protein
MLKKRILDIVKDSSIYGVSKVLGQAISFFLIPLYTSYLTPNDYGILNIFGLFVTSLTLVMNFGLDSATYYFAGMAKDDESSRKSVANAQLLTLLIILVSLIFILIFSKDITALLIDESQPVKYLLISLLIAVLGTIISIPTAYLRINRKVKIIASSTLINVAASIIFTLIFVVVLKMGLVGALIGNLLGSFSSGLFILTKFPFVINNVYDKNVCIDLLKYSLPILPTKVFAFIIPLYSQWSIKQLLSLRELGLYAIALKFTIPLTVILTMFQQAYAPYKYQILKTDENPKTTFVKIMNLFILGFGTLVMLITLFGGDILKFMTNKNYHEAEYYVFYLAVIPFTQGIYFMFSTGMEFSKSPKYRPLISGLGLLSVLISNNFLIKKLGVPGAALSISFSWLVMAMGNLLYAQKLYKIKYNWAIIIFIPLLVFVAGYIINQYFINYLLLKFAIAFILGIIGIYFLKSNYNLKFKK